MGDKKETRSERALRLTNKWLKQYNKISGSNLKLTDDNKVISTKGKIKKRSKKFSLRKLQHINDLKRKDDNSK